jgi:hypothetical protein
MIVSFGRAAMPEWMAGLARVMRMGTSNPSFSVSPAI